MGLKYSIFSLHHYAVKKIGSVPTHSHSFVATEKGEIYISMGPKTVLLDISEGSVREIESQ